MTTTTSVVHNCAGAEVGPAPTVDLREWEEEVAVVTTAMTEGVQIGWRGEEQWNDPDQNDPIVGQREWAQDLRGAAIDSLTGT